MNAPSDTTPQERFSGVQAHLTQHSTASHPPHPKVQETKLRSAQALAKKLERDLTVPGHLHCSAVPIRSAVPLTTMLAAMTSGSTQMDSTKKVCGEHQGGPEGTEHRHVRSGLWAWLHRALPH